MTVKMLRAEAERLGIKRLSALKKDELIDAILTASAESSAAKAPKDADKKDSAKAKADKPKAAKAADTADAAKADKPKAAKTADAAKADKPKADAAVKAAKSQKADADADAKAVSKKAASTDALDEDSEDSADAAKKLKDEELKAAKVEEPAPVEPDSIFIDHGAILPEFVPGTCLFALVRDPGTLFVYWNANFESDNGWILTAYDASGRELQSFMTPARRNGRGYFHIPTTRVTRVTLRPNMPQGMTDFHLESKILIAQQLGIFQPKPAFDERWVDFGTHEVVYEAPAAGRAPSFHDVYQSMANPSLTAGGFDRSLENHGAAGSTSSRFGSLNAPGSSDILIGSSDRLTRK